MYENGIQACKGVIALPLSLWKAGYNCKTASHVFRFTRLQSCQTTATSLPSRTHNRGKEDKETEGLFPMV